MILVISYEIPSLWYVNWTFVLPEDLLKMFLRQIVLEFKNFSNSSRVFFIDYAENYLLPLNSFILV